MWGLGPHVLVLRHFRDLGNSGVWGFGSSGICGARGRPDDGKHLQDVRTRSLLRPQSLEPLNSERQPLHPECLNTLGFRV